MKKWITGILVAVFFFSFLIPVNADSLDELRKKQEQIEEEIEETRKSLEEKKKQEKTLSQQVKELAYQISTIEADLRVVERRLLSAEQKVEKAERELERIEEQLNNKISVFKERLRDIYQNRDVKLVEVFTNSTSLTDFLVRLEMFKKVAEYDVQMLDEIKEKKKEQEVKKEELEEKRDQVLALKEEMENKRAKLKERQDEQQKLLLAIRQQKEYIERALKEEEEAHKQITAMIRKLELEQKGLSSRAPNKIIWPTPGYKRITSDYGWRIHPIMRTRRWHSGIDIGAAYGSKVVAGADGKVVLAKWYGAYGNTVIILHGGGIATMYAHLSRINVQEGEFVARGQEIGRIGSTGLSTGPHLHFEVMKNGNDIDPMKFLR